MWLDHTQDLSKLALPITKVSSCGASQVVEVGPASDQGKAPGFTVWREVILVRLLDGTWLRIRRFGAVGLDRRVQEGLVGADRVREDFDVAGDAPMWEVDEVHEPARGADWLEDPGTLKSLRTVLAQESVEFGADASWFAVARVLVPRAVAIVLGADPDVAEAREHGWREIVHRGEAERLFREHARRIGRVFVQGSDWRQLTDDAIGEASASAELKWHCTFKLDGVWYCVGVAFFSEGGIAWEMHGVRWSGAMLHTLGTVREKEDAGPLRAVTVGGIERELLAAGLELVLAQG